jgi:hypothetical protein
MMIFGKTSGFKREELFIKKSHKNTEISRNQELSQHALGPVEPDVNSGGGSIRSFPGAVQAFP